MNGFSVRSMGKVEIIRKESLVDAAPPAGGDITRAAAFEKEGVWAGRARIGANLDSGWHHHGEHDTYVFVTTGRGRFESGPGGKDVAETGPGDIVFVPAGAVHRELTDSEGLEAFVVRIGRGELVFPAPGPE